MGLPSKLKSAQVCKFNHALIDAPKARSSPLQEAKRMPHQMTNNGRSAGAPIKTVSLHSLGRDFQLTVQQGETPISLFPCNFAGITQ
jgi:hypothetical protein